MDIIKLAQAEQAALVKWRRDLHQCPELGLELPQTVAYISQQLDDLGISYDASYVNGNAIVALIEGQGDPAWSGPDRVLAMRADMDGLPIQEATGHDFASKNKNMHACGHDSHVAMLLAAAKILQANRSAFAGTVKLLFQPGEEYPGGAEPMIKEGAMENPQVTMVTGFHAGHIDPNTPAGKIGYCQGPMMASMDRFLIEVKGQGWHGAYPESSRDPIAAAGQLITAIQTIKSRNIKATTPAVVSITRVEGGYNQNIIPDKVELEGTVRAFDDQVRKKIASRLQEIATGIGQAMDVDCQLTYDYKYPAVINDPQASQILTASLKDLFGPDKLHELTDPLMGGEDFAYYLKEAPGAFFFLANPGLIDGSFHGHHHSKFDIDEDLMYMGTAAFVKMALDYLKAK
ncbi:N-acyl-L-amino acid amidohydrolase [Aerococcus urinaehominis]|uniref:N-acyl-L-amino acid amidohydrolase n=1 Tax=Aerococcus urinaehominis TaxID=128944 RepID=A0A109RHN4_9LACT|nr:M20 family metallopeptidase [Aerococcus urinaehominis]AMB99101.1 N-acyl-L-amino acid amidohydrolase [Aerococcus urinaehominis]SDM03716.1 amidohydrolase [Aerococcus urinaehominis]